MQVTIVPEKIERGSSAAASPRRCKFAGRISEDQPRLAGSAPSCSFASSTPTGRYYDRPGKGSHEIWYSPITKLGSRFPIEPMSRTETCERDFKSRPDCRITSSGGRHGRIGLLAVFCCFPGNYQRTASHSRRESWTSARSRAEITAKQPLFFRCFSLFVEKCQGREAPAPGTLSVGRSMESAFVCEYHKFSFLSIDRIRSTRG
jgi:hypothetical protein